MQVPCVVNFSVLFRSAVYIIFSLSVTQLCVCGEMLGVRTKYLHVVAESIPAAAC